MTDPDLMQVEILHEFVTCLMDEYSWFHQNLTDALWLPVVTSVSPLPPCRGGIENTGLDTFLARLGSSIQRP